MLRLVSKSNTRLKEIELPFSSFGDTSQFFKPNQSQRSRVGHLHVG
jgi:hypothetical protein